MNGQHQQLRYLVAMTGCGYMGLSNRKRERLKAWILPSVRTDLFNRVLADCAQHFGIGKHKHVLLLIDQAGWHMGD